MSGCATRTWEDEYAVREAAPAVGSHYKRVYKPGDRVMPAINPRERISGEGVRLLIDNMRRGG